MCNDRGIGFGFESEIALTGARICELAIFCHGRDCAQGYKSGWKDGVSANRCILKCGIFDFKKEFENGIDDIPYKEFIIVHEMGHCIDHIEKVSFSKKWQSISGWKKCDIDGAVPEGYDRFIRKKRKNSPDPKRSGWIYKEGSKFCRRYSSRNPREDFADSFAFAVFKCYSKFEGEQGKEKLDIVKKVLDQIS